MPWTKAMIPFLVLLSTGIAPAAEGRRARRIYDRKLAARMVPLLTEVLRFPTVAGNEQAHADQKAWLTKVGRGLGFAVRDAGKVVEIELPGPTGAPVLGLVVHGDVQPVDAGGWTIPPFEGAVRDGQVLGRGAADDKGPMVQALLAMEALERSGLRRTHTVRLLVGSDEESDNTDMKQYLEGHAAPDLSLVLDYQFPVVVGEKAWNALRVRTHPGPRKGSTSPTPYGVVGLQAGLSPSIVPDRARLRLRWLHGSPQWEPRIARWRERALPEGTRATFEIEGSDLQVTVHGKAAHGGVNLEGGRNALVALARLMEGALPPGGEDDLLALARLAGQDLYGTGLGLTRHDPIWGRYGVNVATLERGEDGRLALTVVLRRTPPMTGPELREHLKKLVAGFNARTGADLELDEKFFYDDQPIFFDPASKVVRRLLAAYTRATGKKEPPVVAGGGTYAKRLPHAIAFGMWFPGAPYPGHDVDERNPIEDLHAGTGVLIEALADLACSPPLREPFVP